MNVDLSGLERKCNKHVGSGEERGKNFKEKEKDNSNEVPVAEQPNHQPTQPNTQEMIIDV